MGTSAQGPPVTGDIRTSHVWHGTPELFAHVIRVLHVQAADPGDTVPPTLLVDVVVGDDHERFGSAEDFLARLSPEALRSFAAIEVTATGARGTVSLHLSWVRSWWRPGMGPDSQIVRKLTGPAQWCAAAGAVVDAAVRRGDPTPLLKTGRNVAAGGVLMLILGFVASLSLVLLFDMSEIVSVVVLVGIPSVAFVGGLLVGTWMFPELEIAKPGRRRYSRFLRAVVPVLVALAVGGISKRLFG